MRVKKSVVAAAALSDLRLIRLEMQTVPASERESRLVGIIEALSAICQSDTRPDIDVPDESQLHQMLVRTSHIG